jgi:prevent-host-death family protein
VTTDQVVDQVDVRRHAATLTEVGVHEAKTHLSRLLRRVAAGEEIVITSGGRPTARLVPMGETAPREFGIDRGVVIVEDDFDAPLPDEVVRTFQG